MAHPHFLLLTKYFPPKVGGVPNYYENLLSFLKKTRATVITEKYSNQDCSDFKDEVFPHKIIRENYIPDNIQLQASLDWIRSLMKLVIRIIKTVYSDRIDFIIVGQVQIYFLLAAYISKIITRKPYILFLHGEEIPQIYLKSNIIMKYLCIRACGSFCNSNFTSNRYKKFVQPHNVKPVIITPGVEDRYFNDPGSDALKRKMMMENKRIILTIARLDERKGQDMVVKCMPLVLKKHPNAVYVIGGTGPCLEHLKSLVKEYSLEENVILLGFVPDADILSYFNMGEIFIMANRILENGDSEGFGIVFLEANAMGKPVIGGDEGGSVDAIIDGLTGYLVNPRDEKDIASKICMLLSDHVLCNKIGQQGRERASREYRWPSISHRFEESLINLYTHLNG